jgi:acetylornithine deacetylase/succinyl-diaminopimelate desuccinylase-like protein
VAGYLTNAVAFVERGIPSIVFGPGDVALAHTDHEYVDLTELEAAEQILRIFLDK